MLRTLKMRSLTFTRAAEGAYVDAGGNFVASEDLPTTFPARGSLQPLSQKEKETIPTKSGVINSTAYYFYTKTGDIQPVGKTIAEADRTEIGGETFLVWANSQWQGIKATTHNVITLIKEDEVATDV